MYGSIALLLLFVMFHCNEAVYYTSTTTREPTPRPTTMDKHACMLDGKIFQNGEDIEKDPNNCHGMYCDYGGIVAWDAACFFSTPLCPGQQVKVDGQCCPECITTTTPRTTTPFGCLVNDTFYDIGEDIPQDDPCKTCRCTRENGVICALASCAPVQCVNPIKRKKDCCPTCPQGPNCWYGRRKIKVGEVYQPKPNVQCACPDPYEPLACCKKLPGSTSFLKNKLRKQSAYMNPILKAYIQGYLGNK